jgi:hypothetical protein
MATTASSSDSIKASNACSPAAGTRTRDRKLLVAKREGEISCGAATV